MYHNPKAVEEITPECRRLIGGIEASERTAKMLREAGYRLLPA